MGSTSRPRLNVFKSLIGIYAQIIDDVAGHTLVAASSRELTDAKGNKTEIAKMVGTELAKKASEKGIASVAFDRGVFLYHGRIKALADGAREGGLTF